MGQRDDRHQHANRRRKVETTQSAHAREKDEGEERVPLAGYEALYDISRRGRVYSRKTGLAQRGAYARSPFIRIAVNGAIMTLPKERAVSDSFARATSAAPALSDPPSPSTG